MVCTFIDVVPVGKAGVSLFPGPTMELDDERFNIHYEMNK